MQEECKENLMSMAVGAAGGGGGRRRRGKRRAPMADINMTPFIDVILVLLIIFMVAAPLLTVGVPLDLPKTSAGQINIEQKPLTVSVKENGVIYVQDKQVALVELAGALQAQAKQGFDERIYVRGAKTVEYGKVIEVMAVITKAGYKRTAMITEPQEKN
jgi:biopolymer transport protein TolR